MSHSHSSPDLTSLKFVFPNKSLNTVNPKNRMLHRISNSIPHKIKPSGTLDYRQIIRHFQRQSTFHGICHAATAKDKTSRLFWHIAFVVCFLFLAVQIFWVFQRYLQYAKTVDLDIKFENVLFPAVTLCNLNPYKASAIYRDPATKNTMNVFVNVLSSSRTGVRSKRNAEDSFLKKRRYHQVYSKCYCEVNRLNGTHTSQSCFSAYEKSSEPDTSNGTDLDSKLSLSKCLCQFDLTSKALWPCFPPSSWKEKLCKECNPLGHCPMRFYDTIDENANTTMEMCKCNKEYNHCVANNEIGTIPEIFSHEDISRLNFSPNGEDEENVTTTTQIPEFMLAMGFDELLDEIAIHSQAQQNLMFAVGEKAHHERIALSHSRDELILKCSFNQRDCDIINDFKLHYDPTYGNCYTFNWNRTRPVTVHRAGANYGLRILLYSNRSEYLPTSEATGFRITIHDQWGVPFPDAFGYSAPTGFMSSFGVRMKQFHRISPPHGDCLHGGEDSEFYTYKGFNYSVEGCHRSCTQNEVVRVCGCADPMYPIPNNTKPCSVNDSKGRDCIKKVTQYLGVAMAEGRLPNCSCHQPCSEIAYEVYFSTAGWPSGATKLLECEPLDDLCLEKYRKNAAMIQVFYEELNYETLTESAAYTWMSVLADIGGLTGLWIGASVVSLLEIVMLAYYSAQAYQKRRNPNSPFIVNNDECTPLKSYSKFIGNA